MKQWVLAALWILVIFGIEIAIILYFREATPPTQVIKMERADDGTPCYTRGDFFQCDTYRAAIETRCFEYPYAQEGDD